MTKPQSRLKRTLRKHKDLLTVLSASIVFMSFTFKEVAGERTKDRLQELKVGEEKYEHSDDFYSFGRGLDSILNGIQVITDAVTKHEETQEEKELNTIQTVTSRSAFNGINAKHRLSNLVDVSENKEKYEQRLAEIDKRSIAPASDDKTLTQHQNLMNTWANQNTAYNKAYSEIRQLETEVSAEIASSRRHCDLILKAITWATYSLFFLGWSLGLALSLVGVESHKSE